jgi:subtilisin family serine protease
VVVAIIDTGIALSHPDISSHIRINPLEIPSDQVDNDSNGFTDDATGWDFLDGDNDPKEARFDAQPLVSGHGTFVAGLIALIAPEAKIIPIRAFDSSGLSDAFTVAAAIRYAADQGARVINLSFSSPEESQLVRDAVVYARQRGALLVAPAGNDNKDITSAAEFPAGWNQDVLAVAAIDSTGLKADFSNYGSAVSVSAPGVQLYSAYPPVNDTQDYAVWSGTSFAASLVTASASLILEDHPATGDLRGVIETTATSIDDNNPNFRGKLGRGRINPLEALRSLGGPGGGGGGDGDRTIKFIATGIDANAVGEVRIKSSSNLEEIEIFLNDLNSFDNYTILIDGFSLGRVMVDGQGRLLMKWSSQPDEGSFLLPPEVRPLANIRRVEVLDAAGRVVLSASAGP